MISRIVELPADFLDLLILIQKFFMIEEDFWTPFIDELRLCLEVAVQYYMFTVH